MTQQPLDGVPILLLIALFVAFNLVAYEVGYRAGGWTKRREPDADEGATGLIVGAILGLMAFLLAIAMGMAADRFDNRRGLVLEESNAIGTAYLQAGYLTEPASSDSRDLLREYVPLRIATSDPDDFAAAIDESERIQTELWSIAEDVARTQGSDVTALYVQSVNDVINLHEQRLVAGLYARVPPTVLWLLIIGVILSIGLVGYNAGMARKRSPLIAVALAVSLGAVIWLVVDLDRPQDGLINVSQQPLIDLQERLDASP